MDNKYGLGSTRVAQEHHETHFKSSVKSAHVCHACGSEKLTLCKTMQDHRCDDCGAWQNDAVGYSTGRSADY
ncbi:MAG: hypothetical protein U1E13_09885 [Methylophilaceae bacterium]|nr:hypothetical protein [Methylophilaceae bacterium]